MIKVIEQVGREWNRLHPTGPRIGVADISTEYGGEFCWYVWEGLLPERQCKAYHQQGLEADVRYVRSDGEEMVYEFSHTGYSQQLSQDLVNLFCAAGVKRIYATSLASLAEPPGCILDYSEDSLHRDQFRVQIWVP